MPYFVSDQWDTSGPRRLFGMTAIKDLIRAIMDFNANLNGIKTTAWQPVNFKKGCGFE
jgi:hypothetical protein